jgi:hypothetical protein
MADSDDDLPPPLDDMSEKITAAKAMREKAQPTIWNRPREDEGEEIRLKPKAPA